MLNELETLSKNIGRLIAINEHAAHVRNTLDEQIAQLRAQHQAAQSELAQLRGKCNALQRERDALAAKIDDAQVRLNAILDKLPLANTPCEPTNQLDLLAAHQDNEAGHLAAGRGENT